MGQGGGGQRVRVHERVGTGCRPRGPHVHWVLAAQDSLISLQGPGPIPAADMSPRGLGSHGRQPLPQLQGISRDDVPWQEDTGMLGDQGGFGHLRDTP